MPDIIDEKDFPSNSRKARVDDVPRPAEGEQPHKISKVVSGKVVQKKKSIIDKFSETFFGDDARSVGNYIVFDVLVPAAKNTVSEMVSTGIEMLLFGEARGDRTRRDKTKSYVSYTGFYRGERERPARRDDTRNRARHKFDDIIIETRGEAEEVLSSLVDQIEDYGAATVGDVYDLVGMTTDFADNKYGWTNLSRAEVRPVRGGYVLLLPNPHPLDER